MILLFLNFRIVIETQQRHPVCFVPFLEPFLEEMHDFLFISTTELYVVFFKKKIFFTRFNTNMTNDKSGKKNRE